MQRYDSESNSQPVLAGGAEVTVVNDNAKIRRATFGAIYFRLILFYSVKGKHISLVFLLNGEDELLVFEK